MKMMKQRKGRKRRIWKWKRKQRTWRKRRRRS